MEREIKVRIWRKIPKIFEYDQSSCFFILSNLCNEPENTNFIVQQYTGLKDKNGKEIYEGDIVKIYDNIYILANGLKESKAKYVVEWKGLGFVFKLLNGEYMIGCGRDSNPQYKIIGNIFENLELLK